MMNDLDLLLLNLPMSISAKTVAAKSKIFSPLGLLYIGTVLQKIGYIVEISDLMEIK